MYSLTTLSLNFPQVSAKYPSAQKLSPHKNSSNSGNSSLIFLLLPPLKIWTALLKLILGRICISIWTWSDWILNSSMCHLLISAHCRNKYSSLFLISPVKTLFLYLGIQTIWYISLNFVCPPVQYLLTHLSFSKIRYLSKSLRLYNDSSIREKIHPQL